MLDYHAAFSSLSTDDIPRAKAFYGEVLGLDATEENDMLTLKLTGGQTVLIYPKPDHQPAAYTTLNFAVPNIEVAVDGLTDQGVVFEHYGESMGQDERGIMRGWGPPIAWFKDPAGNILAVVEQAA